MTGIVRIGETAPDFVIEGYNARMDEFQTYRLSDCAGKWVVLFFYPGDFTFVCPTELMVLAAFRETFYEMGVQVFVISADSKYVHKKWNELELQAGIGENYPYPMLSDPTGVLGSPYCAYDAEAGVNLRGTVMIAPDGIVKAVSVNAPELGRNPLEILRSVQGLIEHEASGLVMPACWSPGREAISPSIENSGKVLEKHKGLLTSYLHKLDL